jgi:hypothetical protein
LALAAIVSSGVAGQRAAFPDCLGRIARKKVAPPTPAQAGLELSAVFIDTTPTPQIMQETHAGQPFWPNLFLGRWLKGLSW